MTPISAPRADERVLNENGAMRADPWMRFVSRVTAILGGREPAPVIAYAQAALPDASGWTRCCVLVTDYPGGQVPVWSDGTVWRLADGTAI